MIILLSFLWQLPQNLLGLLFVLFARKRAKKSVLVNSGKFLTVYFTDNVFGCGISLGRFILLDYDYFLYASDAELREVVSHEHGHQIQSLITGPLYLLIVGIPSAFFNNMHDRIFHKKWSQSRRNSWYYSRFPENWADRLGGVKR